MKTKDGSTTTRKKLRPVGDILCNMEDLLLELGVDHDMQWHEILNLVHGWLQVHLPGQQETYNDDGSNPEFYYGPKRT